MTLFSRWRLPSAAELGVKDGPQPLVSGVTVEALMPVLGDFELRQLDRRFCNPHVEFASENGRDWPGHCCDRIGVLGKNGGRGEAWYVRDDIARRKLLLK